MRTRPILCLALAGVAALAIASGPHISARYTVQPAVLDGGGARAVAGTYTNLGSLNDIAGTGSVGVYTAGHGYIAQLVTVPGDCPAFTAWQTTHFGSPANPAAAPAADPDRDGADNLAEFAFNMDPNAPDAAPLPPGGTAGLPRFAVETVEGSPRLTVEFIRRPACIQYLVQGSVDLQNWTETATVPVGAPVALPGGMERVKLAATEPFGATARRFLRVVIQM